MIPLSSLNQSVATVVRFTATRTTCLHGTTIRMQKYQKAIISCQWKKHESFVKVKHALSLHGAPWFHVCEQAIKDSGIDCELIDLQTLVPWDRDTVVNSIKKTGRCVIVHEAPKTSGFGAEMSASIQERCFYHLEAPITRVTGWDTPFPHTTEWDYMPSPERIAAAIKKTQEE